MDEYQELEITVRPAGVEDGTIHTLTQIQDIVSRIPDEETIGNMLLWFVAAARSLQAQDIAVNSVVSTALVASLARHPKASPEARAAMLEACEVAAQIQHRVHAIIGDMDWLVAQMREACQAPMAGPDSDWRKRYDRMDRAYDALDPLTTELAETLERATRAMGAPPDLG